MCRFHKTEFDLLPERAFRPTGGRMTLEGGKGGSSAPAPDPRLVEAQIRSMGIQDDAIARIMAVAEEMAPIQREQMQFGLDSARTAFNDAREDRAFSVARRGVLSGLQDRMADEATSFNTDARRDELAGEASADVAQAFDGMRGQLSRSLGRTGVNPGSGAATTALARLAGDETLAKVTGMGRAREAARTEGRQLTDRAANALSGFPAMSMQATGAGAQYAASGLTLANTGLAGLNSGSGSAAQIAGQLGANASSMYGQQANYKVQQDRLALEDGGAMQLAGMLGGAAITKFSDRRLKRDARKIRDDERGFGWYEFDYVWGGERQVGVMADEIERVIPQAVGRSGGYATVNYAML